MRRTCLCRQGKDLKVHAEFVALHFIPILGDCQHFVDRVVSYGFVWSSTESMFFLSVFLELVALSRKKFVPRISAFLFLGWVSTYPFFLRGRKEEKLCVST